jgi:NAD(P)-dependent dehydrogenase (short-subunit alcohol dehydrogenase family)
MPTVLITGAGRGLGLELAEQYAADGWRVLACARTPQSPALQALLRGCAGRASAHGLDVTDHAAVDALAKSVAGTPIDVLLNCAGTMGAGSFATQGPGFGRFGSSDYADWLEVFRLNVLAPMKMAEAFVEHVAASEQKKIVTLTSILGSMTKNSFGGLYAYRASKAAVNAIMRSMAIDLGKSHGIIAAPLHPGWVRTDMGGPRADIDAVTSATGMRGVIAALTPARAGRYWMYNGEELPW